jgi:general secretion pathway protein M
MKQTLLQRWHQLSPHEQQRLRWAAGVLVLVLIWRVALAPAWQSIDESEQKQAQLTQALASMQSMAAQAQRLQTQTPMPAAQSLKTLDALSTSTNGVRIKQQGQRVLVTLTSVTAQNLASWLSQARTQAKTVVQEAHLTSLNDQWTGTLILSLPGKER